jgi:hypothetical protein
MPSLNAFLLVLSFLAPGTDGLTSGDQLAIGPAPAPAPDPAPAAAAPAPSAPPAQGPAEAAPAPTQENPIPPNIDGPAVATANGGYCYGGPHPAPGGGWEAIQTPHVHDYGPFDLRLFSYSNGCYYFIGDPRDFGYSGQTYSYYGAHPVADVYGGGWCFMVGPHYHWWRPWSSYFTVVGPWYYWNGPYDPFFWAYWPYYSFYYRSYYPTYYAGGAFYRNGYRPAPRITHVPATGWRGSPAGTTGGWRGSPATAGGGWRGSPATATANSPLRSGSGYTAPNNNARGAAPNGGWHGTTQGNTPNGGWHGAAPNGGWHAPPNNSGGGWHAPPSAGGWYGGTPRGGYQSAPPASGWHGGAPSGGWHAPPASSGWHGGGSVPYSAPRSGGGFHGGGGGGFHFHGGHR